VAIAFHDLLARARASIASWAAPDEDSTGGPAAELAELRERLNALEAMVEGLQDAVYRQSVQQDHRFEELERRLEPDELARVLSDDARKRGL